MIWNATSSFVSKISNDKSPKSGGLSLGTFLELHFIVQTKIICCFVNSAILIISNLYTMSWPEMDNLISHFLYLVFNWFAQNSVFQAVPTSKGKLSSYSFSP